MSDASAVEALLFAALEKATAAERAAYLDSACAGDAELRRQVEKLLKAHANVGDFLQKPIVEQLAAAPEPGDVTQEIASTDGPDAVPGGRTGHPLARSEGGGASDEDDSLTFLQPSSRPDSLGRLGHYEVLEVLGQGGFGIVFRAFDEQLQRVVAIKVLAPEMAATSPARKRFLREARASARVRHENVVQIYAVAEEPLPYLVMEFIPGETLQQRLDRTGPLKTADVVQLGRQIAEGLAAAHARGLIHRDIKPANILIEASANPCVKITDFGLARAADDASLTQSGIVAGTPMYMAPEQAQGETLDHRADLFSLGSVLYTMCSGRPPFRANSTLAVLKRVAEDAPRPIPEIIPEVPPWLCDLITRLHAKKPEDRFATAQEVADLLARGLEALRRAVNFPSLLVVAPPVETKLPAGEAPTEPQPPDPAGASPAHRGREEKAPAGTVELPKPAPAARPRFPSSRWVAAAVILLLLGGLGVTEATGVTKVRGTVIRLFSPEGTLEIQVDDPGVSVQIDGSDLVITGAGVREIRLKPGRYTVEGRKDGKVVSRDLVTVTKDGKQIVRVRQEAVVKGPDPKTAPEEKKVPPQTGDPDRRAAKYVLSVGGSCMDQNQGSGIKALAQLPNGAFRLTSVDLANTKATDAGLAVFTDCKNLTQLILNGTPVSDAGLAAFKNCKNLMSLNLLGTQVGDAGLAHLKDCKNLNTLWLHRTKVTDAGLAHLKDCKYLDELWLAETQVGDAGLAHLKGCKKLTQLALGGTKVTGAGLAHLKDIENPWSLVLTNAPVTDEGLAHCKDCKTLTTLGLVGTKVTDAGLAHLAGLGRLSGLDLTDTKVTTQGVEGLAKALPKCRITWGDRVFEPK